MHVTSFGHTESKKIEKDQDGS